MKQLKEYEKRWIAARNEYRLACSKFQRTRLGLTEDEKETRSGIRIMKAAKEMLSEAAKKFEIEKGLFNAAKNPPAEIEEETPREEMERILSRLSDIMSGVMLPEERTDEINRARYGNEKDALIEAGRRGIELARMHQKTGKSIEELASSWEDSLELGLESLEEKKFPEAARPENIDWMAGARAERLAREQKSSESEKEKEND